MAQLIDIAGKKLGTFTVNGRASGTKDTRSAWWNVACDCGAERAARGDLLRGLKVACWKCGRGFIPNGRIRCIGDLADIISTNSEFITECGCQIWMAGVDGHGYGQIRLNGKMEGAHRASWRLVNGSIPSGLHVLHRCDVPPCINPSHLFLGTQADNMADMYRKRRHWAHRR
jgi:hypothetical protein